MNFMKLYDWLNRETLFDIGTTNKMHVATKIDLIQLLYKESETILLTKNTKREILTIKERVR